MICRQKSGGHRASNKSIRRSSYRKGHQLYILLSFDSVRALEIHGVACATSRIACALEMRSSNGRELPSSYYRGRVVLGIQNHMGPLLCCLKQQTTPPPPPPRPMMRQNTQTGPDLHTGLQWQIPSDGSDLRRAITYSLTF